MSDSPLMRPREAADLLAVSTRHIYTMIAQGELAATHVGQRSVRVYRDQVEAIVEQGRVHALAQ